MKYLKKFEQKSDLNEELIDACIESDIEDVISSINKGADVNYVNDKGFTPLIYAINKFCNINIVKLLIKEGANVNFQDNTNQGYTPLLLASFWSSVDEVDILDAIKILIESNADWNIKGRMINITFLDYLKPEIQEIIKNEYPDKYKDYLLKQNSDKFNI